jgi:hypothetical protein
VASSVRVPVNWPIAVSTCTVGIAARVSRAVASGSGTAQPAGGGPQPVTERGEVTASSV